MAIPDRSQDLRHWIMPPPPNPPTPPAYADVKRFALSASSRGVCARWTFASSPHAGVQLDLVIRGPMQAEPNGAKIWNGYGFAATLTERGATLEDGRSVGGDPNIVKGDVVRDGDTIAIAVSRAELSRPTASLPDRPPFPYRAFSFQARVITPVSPRVAYADFVPDEIAGDAGLVSGRLCPYPCSGHGLLLTKPTSERQP